MNSHSDPNKPLSLIQSFTPFFTLIEREYYRFFRLAGQTIAPPIIMTILFIVIFGYSLGTRIREISGFSYIVYILPGLACMGAITNAYSNSTTSLFMAKTDRSIENILVTPISYVRIVASFVIGGMTRGVLVGGITLLVAIPLAKLEIASVLWTGFYLFTIAVFFSSFGIITAMWADGWDNLATISNFVITPFVYLGGVFYSIDMLPPMWRTVSSFNPLFYMIDGLRWAVLGKGDTSPWLSGSLTLLLALGAFSFAVYLFRRGYKLIV